jgi:hypothetical protein
MASLMPGIRSCKAMPSPVSISMNDEMIFKIISLYLILILHSFYSDPKYREFKIIAV